VLCGRWRARERLPWAMESVQVVCYEPATRLFIAVLPIERLVSALMNDHLIEQEM
jgi:hypothetical protein